MIRSASAIHRELKTDEILTLRARYIGFALVLQLCARNTTLNSYHNFALLSHVMYSFSTN